MPSLEDLPISDLLERAKKTEQSDALLAALLNNPETREQTLRAVKKVDPSRQIPEIDARDAVGKDIEELRREQLRLEAELRASRVQQDIERQRAKLKQQYQFTDDDVAAVEALMIDKDDPIPSYTRAAQAYIGQRQMAPATPASYTPPIYEMPAQDVWGKGMGNPATLNKIATEQAYKALAEIKSGKIAGA